MFNPNPIVPLCCDTCSAHAKHHVYNKSIKFYIYLCDKCVPSEGTPRMKRVAYREDGFDYQAPPPPGILY